MGRTREEEEEDEGSEGWKNEKFLFFLWTFKGALL